MSRSYPIWNQVTNCKYQSDKSYGNVDTGEVNIFVGSSSKNSHSFVNTKITKRIISWKNKSVFAFKFSVDDVVLKVALFEKNKDVPGKLIKIISKMKTIKSLRLD